MSNTCGAAAPARVGGRVCEHTVVVESGGTCEMGRPPLRPVCPECAQGKHQNCTGWALNEATDEIVDCHCESCKTDAAERAAIVEQRRAEWEE